MAVTRKTFRIEERAALSREPHVDDVAARHAEIMEALDALRAMLAAALFGQAAGDGALPPDGMGQVAAKLRLIHSTIVGAEDAQVGRNGSSVPAVGARRIAGELEAVSKACEQATEKILAAAEDIDQAADTLSAVLNGVAEQALAQDIRDRVIAIFEACNFQDLTSQRVAKVLTAVGRIEQQIAGALDELARAAAPPLHGPRLESDRGHVSQSDVDAMFGGTVLQC